MRRFWLQLTLLKRGDGAIIRGDIRWSVGRVIDRTWFENKKLMENNDCRSVGRTVYLSPAGWVNNEKYVYKRLIEYTRSVKWIERRGGQ